MAVNPKTVKPFKFNSPKPHAMLNGRGQQCCEFIVTYMNNEYCGPSPELHVQTKIAKVLYKIVNGYAPDDKQCIDANGKKLGDMPRAFQKRCVGRENGKRMGILDFYQHQEKGILARAHACEPGNRCGLKLTVAQANQGVKPKCAFCNSDSENGGGGDDGEDDDDDDDDDDESADADSSA